MAKHLVLKCFQHLTKVQLEEKNRYIRVNIKFCWCFCLCTSASVVRKCFLASKSYRENSKKRWTVLAVLAHNAAQLGDLLGFEWGWDLIPQYLITIGVASMIASWASELKPAGYKISRWSLWRRSRSLSDLGQESWEKVGTTTTKWRVKPFYRKKMECPNTTFQTSGIHLPSQDDDTEHIEGVSDDGICRIPCRKPFCSDG